MILTEKLTINGNEVAIAGYTIKTPTGGMAQSLTIALVEGNLDLLPDEAEITFEIGAGKVNPGTGEVDYSYAPPILENGRLNGLSYSAAWIDAPDGGKPNDVLEFTAMSPLADKLTLAPQYPVTMYDPLFIDGAKLTPDLSQLIRFNGDFLRPVIKKTENLNLNAILDYAYKTGCGYSRVINNFPPAPFDRVDFTPETGYHAPAAALYGLFAPVPFEDGQTLYLLSPEYGLPPGFDPIELDPLCVIEIKRNQETAALVNAMILQYFIPQGAGTAGEIPDTYINNDEPQITGEGQSYVRIEESREITDFLDVNTGSVRRSQENWTNKKTFAFRPYRNISVDADGNTIVDTTPENGRVVLVMEERTENTFAGFTKSGHTRTVKAMYLNPEQLGAEEKYDTVLTERASLEWQPDIGHPGEYSLTYRKTYVEGLCLVEKFQIEKEDEVTHKSVKYEQKVYTPILEAQDAQLITGDGTQEALTAPLYTILERLRDTGQNQKNIEPIVINHLTGGGKPTNITSATGSTSTYIPPFSVKYGGGLKTGTIRELIVNQDSIDNFGFRMAKTLDVGRISPEEGRKIVARRLKMGANPPRTFEISLPGINFFYRRGLVVKPPLRSGFDRACIITGTTITGKGLHTPQGIREMSLEARELVSNG